MEEDGEALSSPFWAPSSGNKRRRNDGIIHGLSSLIFNSGLLVLLLLVTALSFLIFVVPSTLSFSAQIFKPNTVKKSWDSLNLILVAVALLLGLLCRNKNEEIVPADDDDQGFRASSSPVIRNEYRNGEASKSNHLPSPHKWYDYSDQNQSFYSSSVSSRDMFLRTSSSYPDLRQVPSSQKEFSDDPWRFSDDINWATGTGQFLRRRSWKDKSDEATGSVRFSDDIYWGTGGTGQQRLPSWKEKTDETAHVRRDKAPIEINSREADVSAPIPSPPAPLPPPLPMMTLALPEEKPKRTNGDQRGRNRRRKVIEMETVEPPPISPVVAASPSPPPPPPMPQFADPDSSKRSLKNRSGGSATKDFLNSLYHKKKKKHRQKSVDDFDSLVNRYQQPSSQPPPPPPPPPPPVSPPVSFNRSTRKRKDAVISASSGTATSQFLTVAVNIPPKAVAVSNYYGAEESSNSGGESPLTHIPPPPPPPPPFSKSLAWKFALQGDYVRVDSTASSRDVSPEPYDADSDRTPMAGDGRDATPMTTASSLFCPSPDVDTKADKFISNFWAGLKLEKINSLNKKHGLGLSNLGPGSGPTQR